MTPPRHAPDGSAGARQDPHPLVTIAITCFNAEATIAAAIDSARAQDWPNLEIVVVDDASSDGSSAIIEAMARDDERIRPLAHPHNRGYAAALNSAVEAARGDFIAVFDDDDLSRPDRIHRQWQRLADYEAATGANLVFCYSNRRVETPDGRHGDSARAIGRTAPEPHGTDVVDFLLWHRENPAYVWGQFGSCTLLCRRQTLLATGPFDESFRRGAEWDMAIRLALDDGHFIAVNDDLVTQRKTPTPDKGGKISLQHTLALRAKYRDYLRARRLYPAAIAITHARFHFARGERMRSNLYLALACLASPLVLRSELAKRRRNTRPGIASVAKNAGFLFALRALETLLRMAILYFVVRALDKTQFGQYQYILSVLALLTVCGLPGMNNALMQSVARGFPGTYRRALPRALAASVVGSAILLGLVVYQRHRDPGLSGGFLLAAALFPFAYAMDQWKALRGGREDFAGILRLEGAGFVVLATLMIFAVTRWPGEIIVPLAVLLGVQAAWNIAITGRAMARIPRTAPAEPGAIAYGARMTLYSGLNTLANQIDKLLLFSFLSPAALALFVAAERIPELAKNAVQDFAAVLAPRFAKRAVYTRELDHALRRLGMVTGALLVIIAFTALPWMVHLVFGASYADSIPYAQALMCSVAIGNTATLRFRYVTSRLDDSGPRTVNLVMSGTRIVTSLVLVPLFGIVGAIVSAFIYRVATSVVVYLVIKRRFLVAGEAVE